MLLIISMGSCQERLGYFVCYLVLLLVHLGEHGDWLDLGGLSGLSWLGNWLLLELWLLDLDRLLGLLLSLHWRWWLIGTHWSHWVEWLLLHWLLHLLLHRLLELSLWSRFEGHWLESLLHWLSLHRLSLHRLHLHWLCLSRLGLYRR